MGKMMMTERGSRVFARLYLALAIFAMGMGISLWGDQNAAFAQSQPPASFDKNLRLKPPAPGPKYLQPADYRSLKSLLEAIEKKRWSTVRNLIPAVNDPQARSLGQWFYYDARDPKVDIRGGTSFLDTHPQWPSLSRIQSHLEGQIDNATPVDVVMALFANRNPTTGNGKIHFIRALMQSGEQEAAKIYAQDSWTTFGFTSSQERTMLSKYGQFLTTRHHIGRVDMLLWGRQVTSSRRTMPRLPTQERRIAEARAALYVRAGNAQQLYRSLPGSARDLPSVRHAAIRYYRRSDQEERAIELVKGLPDSSQALGHPSRFWNERKLLMRWALKNARFNDAYAMANATGLDAGLDLAEAEFNAGWIALRFLNEPERAEKHFLSLASWATSPISTARAYYWLGRAAKADNNEALANDRFSVAAQHIYTYYGQLAAEEIGGPALSQKFISQSVQTQADRAAFDARPTAKAFRMLSDLNHRRALLRFSYNLDDQLDTPGEYLILSEITNAERAPNLTIRAGKTAVRRNAFIPEVSYPLISIPQKAAEFVPPELILGLSRQESEFNPTAYSSAGARGVMQLLPSTAQLTARKERIRYSRSSLLSDPEYNITIGSAHLSHLIERFEGSWILTFVGYNAGPHRATRWISEYGDPRTDAVDPVDWVELIPFSETRNYVQRVLENTQIYRARLAGRQIAGSLSFDLERGGSAGRAARQAVPSTLLANLRPPTDRKPLPPLSNLTQARIANAPVALPAARERRDHLTTVTTPALSPTLQEETTIVQAEVAPAAVPPAIETNTAPSVSDIGNTEPTINEGQPAPSLQPVRQTQSTATQELPNIETRSEAAPNVEEAAVNQPAPSLKIKPAQTTPSLSAPALSEPQTDVNQNAPAVTVPPAPSPSVKPERAQPASSFDPYSADLPSDAPSVDAQSSGASSQTPSSETATSAPDQSEASRTPCEDMRDFVARNAEDADESAADLNAAMLAQIDDKPEHCTQER